jgi:hypothetical protein
MTPWFQNTVDRASVNLQICPNLRDISAHSPCLRDFTGDLEAFPF